jgi:hypothetical protein
MLERGLEFSLYPFKCNVISKIINEFEIIVIRF